MQPTKEIYKKALALAKETEIYDSVIYKGDFYEDGVFLPYFPNMENLFLGAPVYIVVEKGDVRWSNQIIGEGDYIYHLWRQQTNLQS